MGAFPSSAPLRAASLKKSLIRLIFVTLAPILLFSIIVIVLFARQGREAVKRGLLETTRALAVAIDRELAFTINTLQGLATSDFLDVGDIGAFHKRSARFITSQPAWRTIALHDVSGRRLLDLRGPRETEPPRIPELTEGLAAALGTKQPVVEMFSLTSSSAPLVSVHLPVVREGALRYVLTAGIAPSFFADILERQRLPRDWTGTIFDRRNIVVARTPSPDRFVGKPVAPLLANAERTATEIWLRGENGEGAASYAALNRSPVLRWSVAISVPASFIEAPLRRSLWLLTVSGIAYMLVGLSFALFLARRITRSIRSLSPAMEALARGEAVASPRSSDIVEVNALREDIERAGNLLREESGQRDRIESALRASEEEFRAMFQLAGTGTVQMDADTCRFLRVNRKWCEIIGYSAEELRRSTLLDVTHPEDHEESARCLDRLIRNETAECSIDARYVRKDNSIVWGNLTATVIRDPQGRPLHWIGVIQDVTERKRAEDEIRILNLELEQRVIERTLELRAADRERWESQERFRLAFEQGPLGVAMIGAGHKYVRVNQTFCRMLGYRQEELLRLSSLDTTYPADFPVNARLFERLLKGDIPGYRAEKRFVSSARDVVWANVTAAPIEGRNGKAVLELIEDITERKEMEEKLRESERLAAVGATAAVFAHEIGNPLNAISTTVQLLERRFASQAKGESILPTLRDIRKEINRLGALLHEFRSFSRSRKLDLLPTNVAQLAAELLAIEEPQYAQQGIRVELDFAPDLPLAALDGEKINQALLNLCKNAAEAMHEGGNLTVKGYRSKENICLEIIDTGAGIPRGVNAFELFKTTKPQGTGLGLAVVRQIVSAHGGTVTYTSDPGRGTVFRLTLPIAPAQRANQRGSQDSDRHDSPARSPSG